MKTIKEYSGLVALVAIVLGFFFLPSTSTLVGGTTNYDTISVSGLVVGSGCNQFGASCDGTTISRVNTGTCNIQAAGNTITASSTKTIDCAATAGTPPGTALTGVTAGDKCFLSQATSTAPTGTSGLIVLGASASSTSGFITANVLAFGGTFTWSAAASSSWPYYCVSSS